MKSFIKLFVEKLVSGGLGLARIEGRVVLLPGVLPGELVLGELTPPQAGVHRARVVEVLEPSVWRREPDCPLAGTCGGCDFLQVAPEAALGFKSQAALGDLAEKYGLPVELVQSPEVTRYRHRVVFHLGLQKNGTLGVGFYSKKRELVEPHDCRLLAPALLTPWPVLRAWAANLRPEAGGLELGLTLDLLTQEVAASLAPSPSAPGSKRISAKTLAGLQKSLDDALIRAGFNPPVLGPVVAFWPQWDLTLRGRVGGFSQVNPGLNQLLVEKILAWAAALYDPLGENRDKGKQGKKTGSGKNKALDLYSGLGNIALPLVKSGFGVTAVEKSPLAVAAARTNGRGLPGFTLRAEGVEKAVAELAQRGAKFDLVVLDPPRAGALGLAPAVAAVAPELIMYVACHPAVLYRDLPAFQCLGYGLRSLTAFDMFPRTSHLEVVAVLGRI